jgi:hypothetical protein
VNSKASAAWLFRIALALLAAAFVTFVWPTAYRYDHVTVEGDTYPVRIHRITGHADVLVPEAGWLPAEAPWDDAGGAVPESRT